MASWNPLSLLKPKAPRASGTSGSASYNPASASNVQPVPQYRDHLIDLFDLRLSSSSQTLMESMFRNDPDVGAAVNSFLTVADIEPLVTIRDINGAFVPEAYQVWWQMLSVMTMPTDLTKGYLRKPSLRSICEQLRYMLLLRGAIGSELVMDKGMVPTEIRVIDPATIRWYEKTSGQFKPVQRVPGAQVDTSLDIPTFFFNYFRQSPTGLYAYSPFVGAINTIAARQQVINDLYTILKMTGYPRLDITVMEEILKNSAPVTVRNDPKLLRSWLNDRITDIRSEFSNMRPDQALIHTDASAVRMVNEKAAGVAINMDSVISVLNSQNQAGLRTMATIIGRGESGVNTASVEARIFTLNADALNVPIAEMLSKIFTTAFQIIGYPVFVNLTFPPSELRPATELEPQLATRQARVLEALSLGLVTDDEAHMMLYQRLPPPGSPRLMGTKFYGAKATQQAEDLSVNGPQDQPNSLERAARPPGSKNPQRSNSVRR